MNYLREAFKPACNVLITFTNGRSQKEIPLKKDGRTVMAPLFQTQEDIAGEITIEPSSPGKKLDHNGIKVELLGQIEMYFNRGSFYDFTSLAQEVDPPGDICERKTYPFLFSTVEMPYETYNGLNVRLRYVLKVTISRSYGRSITEYGDFVVRNYSPPPIAYSIKSEVGIKDCLRIGVEYNKSRYHLRDTILGSVCFMLVRIKLKSMVLEILRQESIKSGTDDTDVETQTLGTFDLMDGAPVTGVSIPIRIFLSPYELTPTHDIKNKFSVKYFLSLVLIDEEDKRYLKQDEILLYRLQQTS